MNKLKYILVSLALTFCGAVIVAGVNDLPVKTVKGKEYHYYEVQPKETLYSLQHKLGVDRETILKYNPSVEDGLQAHQILYFPVDIKSNPTLSQPTTSVTHVVRKGETVYGISKQYDISTDDLIAQNPQIKDGLKTGQTLMIFDAGTNPVTIAPAKESHQSPAQDNANAQKPAADLTGTPYTIKDGETLYAIALAHGITTDDILNANPGLSPTFYRGGQVIIIPEVSGVKSEQKPEQNTQQSTVIIASGDEILGKDTNSVGFDSIEVVVEEATLLPEQTSIAVILPFMLSEKTISKEAVRYTDFYKGLLIAVDSLKTPERPIAIYAFDSAANVDTVRKILRSPELSTVQMIIAPPDEKQLKLVADFARDNSIMVINPFLVKSEYYRTNPAVMHTNISSADMLAKAVEGTMKFYGSRTPVILRRSGGKEEQRAFVTAVKEAYLEADANPVIITYDGNLTAANLARLNKLKDDFIFIPYESKQEEIEKILPAIIEYRDNLSDPSRVMLFGYPEWVAFKSSVRANLAKANSVVYSRFINDDESIGTRLANNQFITWYGSKPQAGAPNPGLLGIDLGMFLIKALRENGGDFSAESPAFEGIQNAYHFVRPEGQEGWCNDVLYFIEYRPSGMIYGNVL